MSQGNARTVVVVQGPTGQIGPPGPPGATGAQGPPGVGGSATGLPLLALGAINSPRFVGRVSAGSGVPEELTPVQAATMLPVFTLLAAGMVPAPGSSSNRVLQDDGTWVAQSGGGGAATGVTLGQQAVAPGQTFQGRFSLGTGVRQDMTPDQAASLIGGRWGSGLQLLAAPTGGVQGRMLRDDGVWVQPSFTASGLALSQLLPLSPNVVVGRFSLGSGTAEQLAPGQIASLVPWFAGPTGAGLVPQPTGSSSSGFMLSDSGKWAAPTGLNNGQLAPMPPFTLAGRNSTGSGTTEYVTALAVASMLPLFTSSGTTRGLVTQPTGGAAGNFLKDDGTWGTPAGGGGGGGANNPGLPTGSVQFNQGSGIFAGSSGMLFDVGSGLTLTKPLSVGSAVARFNGTKTELNASGISFDGIFGVGNSQFALLPPLSLKGRFTLGSGAAEDLSAGQVASLVPPFQGSGARGVVQGPTGGTVRSFLRDDGQWQIPLASGITTAQLAPIAAPAFRGRISAGSGNVEDLTPAQGASLLPPFFASGARGVVLGPTGGVAGNFLRDDGSWQAVSAGGTATGLTNSQFALMPPLTIKGNNSSGTGAPADLNIGQVASLLGLVSIPSTTPQNLFLRDDGTFQGVPSNVATGLALSQIVDAAPNSFQGRFTLGTGVRQDLTQGQAASLLPRFLGSGAGLVPVPSVVGSGMFLRDDGKWSSPTGLGNGQFALMPPSTIKGTPGATGLPQDLVGSAVGTLLPLFNNIDKGLVPGSAGGTTAFLRADGAWAAPSVGGGVSGVAFNQIADISPRVFLGNTNASGSIQQLSPLTAASMLPRMLGTGFGLVAVPTGGASGYFLRDDGSFVNLIPAKERLVGNVGSGTTVGSATIDFSLDPYQSVNQFGNVQFKLTPPTLHRHTQLRIVVSASGVQPTFFGTAVKWVGGSGAVPAWSAGSGLVNFANFFYDGTIMWGQGGPGAG